MRFKYTFDFIFSLFILPFILPFIFIAIILVFIEDFYSPFYFSKRVGKNFKMINIIKIRTMKKNADKILIRTSTISDSRLTYFGFFLRKYKIDELPQFINVLIGDISIVGPRPNVNEIGVELYNNFEKKLLSVRPGITDFSSILFSNLDELADNSKNPDFFYNENIRPWKSKLGLLYIQNSTFSLDLLLVLITFISIFNKKLAIKMVLINLKNKMQIDDYTVLNKLIYYGTT
ncbi:MAG: sugar transferase [Lutibacter sp.]|nr:sugar transferase [Lutibacter sp.]